MILYHTEMIILLTYRYNMELNEILNAFCKNVNFACCVWDTSVTVV